MLRKHLLRLKKPSDGEDKLEDAHVMKSEEDIEDYDKCKLSCHYLIICKILTLL